MKWLRKITFVFVLVCANLAHADFFDATKIFMNSFTNFSNANSITCKLKSNEKGTVVIEFDQNNKGVSFIDLGLENISTTRIYSRWPMIRGEFSVAYCNPNDNEYREYSRQYYLSAQCTADNGEPAFFQSSFSLNSGGKVSYLKRDLNIVEFEFSDCQ